VIFFIKPSRYDVGIKFATLLRSSSKILLRILSKKSIYFHHLRQNPNKKFDKDRDGFRLPKVAHFMKTTLVRKEDVQNKVWRIVDATGVVLGKLAVKIADVLRGKNKPTFTPHVDNGDFVVVINADKVKVTGKKEEDKQYMFYSMYVGNERRVSFKKMRERRPEFIIEHAVKGMLQKNRLANAMIRKLKVYAGAEHPHTAQQPKPLAI
jgi:large subunit ribosomal protein L13